jgi:hypothetical protein
VDPSLAARTGRRTEAPAPTPPNRPATSVSALLLPPILTLPTAFSHLLVLAVPGRGRASGCGGGGNLREFEQEAVTRSYGGGRGTYQA